MAQQYEYRAMWKAKLQRTRLAETNFLKEYISTFFSIPADPSGVPEVSETTHPYAFRREG